jgi:hypothetical protein
MCLWDICPPLTTWESSEPFQKPRYGRYAIGGHANTQLFTFVQSVIITWRAHELAGWKSHFLRVLQCYMAIPLGKRCEFCEDVRKGFCSSYFGDSIW